MATAEGDLAAAQNVDKIETQECKQGIANFQERINRLKEAATMLHTTHGQVTQQQAFTQVNSMLKELDAPQATSYASESGVAPLIKLVEDLLAESKENYQDYDNECKNTKHQFQLLVQELNDNVGQASLVF